MPSLLNTPLSRRSFFRTAGLAGAVISLSQISVLAKAPQRTFRCALLSDTHIPANAEEMNRGFNIVANLKRITPEVVAMNPELVLINGDVARLDGKVEDYQALNTLIQPITAAAPVCMSLGNHDDRTNFGTVFKTVAGDKQNVTGKHVLVVDHPLLRLVVLDSLLYVNKTAGLLGKAQRDWLAAYLPKAKDRPVALFVHHSLESNDGDLADVDRLFAILKPHRHVKAIFYGHSHVWKMSERQRVKLINLPAVAYNFGDNDPVGWMEAEFHNRGVALTMRACGGNTADNGKTFNVKWS